MVTAVQGPSTALLPARFGIDQRAAPLQTVARA
jgi:hypothetical protein